MANKKYLSLFILLILLGLIGLQGCGQQLAPETPEVVVEPVVTEVREDDEEDDTSVTVPIPNWCDGASDLNVNLDYLEGFTPEGIDVEVCLPGGEGVYTIETQDLAPGLKNQAMDMTETFPIATLMGYFEVYRVDPHEQVFEFVPALQLRIIYADGTWGQALGDEQAAAQGYPRVAYLVLKLVLDESAWSGDWVEFSEDDITVILPGTEGYPDGTGALIIIIDYLPDPAIGGC
jgi:hypothetical protein